MRKKVVDAIDYQIINVLQKDANITNIALSKEIGLSPAPTLKRVSNLFKRGIVEGFKTVINFKYFGLREDILVIITLLNGKEQELISRVLSCNNAIEAFKFTEKADFTFNTIIAFRLICEDTGNMEELVLTLTEGIEGLISVKIFQGATPIKGGIYTFGN